MTVNTAAETLTPRRRAASRGRKRDEERTDAILAAAGEVLLAVGYDRLRIQDVAERAGAGTGAIYRRWPTKEALVAEAIRAMPQTDHVPTDDPAADLRALLGEKAALSTGQPDLLPSMLGAMRSSSEIAAAADECYTLDAYRRAIARIVGDDHPLLDVLAELAPALALHRAAFDGGVDGDRLVDEVMAIVDAVAQSAQTVPSAGASSQIR